MSTPNRVAWDEGMMLAPQHFQQLERWIEAELRDRAGVGSTWSHGFTALEIDRGALAGGQLAIVHMAGVLPDGTAFQCPGRDPLPPARAVQQAFEGKVEAVDVYLCLPQVTPGTSAYGDVGAMVPLLRRRTRLADAARPETEREIGTAQLNLTLRLAGESLDGFRAMPIARVVRGSGGGVELAPGFSPPPLTIAAMPQALSVLRQVTGMVAQKWTELSGKRRGSGSGMADASGLMLLHTVGENLPLLRHCVDHGSVSPERAYLVLARLAAQMCTFHASMTPSEVPAYSHDNPGPCFRELGDMLQELLGDAAPSMCDTLDLQREGEAMYWARVPTVDMIAHGHLYLSVRAEATADEVQARFPSLVKISSKDKVPELLMRAIPGLPVRHVPQPPPAIPSQLGRTYFRLEPGGEHWEAIKAALNLAIHVSPGLPQLGMELLAVKQ